MSATASVSDQISRLLQNTHKQSPATAAYETTIFTTPSPLVKLKPTQLCYCGFSLFVEADSKVHCRHCGAVCIETPEGFIFVSQESLSFVDRV